MKRNNIKKTEYVLIVLRYIKNNEAISDQKGIELCNGYWESVKQELSNNGITSSAYGGVSIINKNRFQSLFIDYEGKLEELVKTSNSNELTDKANKATVKNYRVDVIALVIACVSLLLAIYSLILQYWK